jgi:NAD(P)-dependent dehydrogenase (short-subunit alcohol dehydrogenase family)
VVGAVRDLAKARAATAEILVGDLKLVELDLADLASVRACTDRLLADGRSFDLLVANAGVMATPRGRTVDGFETQFGINHLGHFVLMNRLAPLLQEGGRLVSLSSAGHRIADVDLEDPSFDRTPYDRWMAYGRSKTANVLFAVEFDRRHRGHGVRAAAIYPGGIGTELHRHLSQEEKDGLLKSLAAARPPGVPPFRMKSVAQGVATTAWAGVVAPAAEIGGRYCEDCHVAEIQAGDGFHGGVRPYAVDPENAKALWMVSEKLVREHF